MTKIVSKSIRSGLRLLIQLLLISAMVESTLASYYAKNGKHAAHPKHTKAEELIQSHHHHHHHQYHHQQQHHHHQQYHHHHHHSHSTHTHGGSTTNTLVPNVGQQGLPALPKNGLQFNFYGGTCPQAEDVVRTMVQSSIMNDFTIAAALIRLHFHDCAARNGCDGSILLDSVDGGKTLTEKASPASIGLRGFDLIDEIKAQLESQCPRIVSCADILALVARDATATIGGPFWFEPLGRRDGFESKITDALTMPDPYDSFLTLLRKFDAINLNLVDLVALSGVHTVGVSHCVSFERRLSNFDHSHKPDPTLSPPYAAKLRKLCDYANNTAVVVPNNQVPGSIFSNQYYLNLLAGKVLFASDQELLSDLRAKPLIELFSQNQFAFFTQFSNSIINLGNVKVLTGSKGSIRRVCSSVH